MEHTEDTDKAKRALFFRVFCVFRGNQIRFFAYLKNGILSNIFFSFLGGGIGRTGLGAAFRFCSSLTARIVPV